MKWFIIVRDRSDGPMFMRSICGPPHEPARWSPVLEQAIHYPTQAGAEQAAVQLPVTFVAICGCSFCTRGLSQRQRT